ncbi:hypothetical protein PR202_ga11978 [Eleusine coracana subsp. coracana]|uniref:At3g05675-like ankyrin-like domain-containing protein n=1 Tax=Eleusine coracana subsp. coracana TaxID=191504 RepID=A0AAV5CAX8_ELECO|nr:hypothetical protein PR202_ga11978 [Eleusine coracana subsp. coracana]
MEESRPRRGSPAPGRIRTVPIAVTPEGFWCCPSPAALHKSLKNPHHNHAAAAGNKQPSPKQHKAPSAPPSKAPSVQTAPSVTDEPVPADEQRNQAPAPEGVGTQQEQQRKICVGFGQPETSDLTVMLYGKEGIAVRMSVHRDVLCESSVFFAEKLAGGHGPPPVCVEIHDCDDAEIYVETVGLMYCDEAKHKLLKQSVPQVLRIMKVTRKITLETDNLLWLVEILVNQRISDDFVAVWTSRTDLAELHAKLPVASRYSVSCITARLFVGIGRGEMLPSKNTRLLLLQVWLQALIDDYSWLQSSYRSFDRKIVEDGIGQTILTLPLEDQRSILLSWLGKFLKLGDNCPNLHRAFEVWWRRTFVRPFVNQAEAGNNLSSDGSSS